MSVPISATMTCAVRACTPGIVRSSSTAGAKGTSCSSIASDSRSIASSRKSRCARIDDTIRACSGSKRPSSASCSAGIFARSLPLASSARTVASVVPDTSASSIARPDAPRMFDATQSSLMPVSSRILCSRLASRWRSAICVLRYLVRFRSARIGLGGTKLARSSPASSSCANHAASDTSVLRPGTCLTWRALTSTHANSSSRIAHGGFQYTPVASIATCVTPCAFSQSRSPSRPCTVVLNSATSSSRPPLPSGTLTAAVSSALCTSKPPTRSKIRSNTCFICHPLGRDRRCRPGSLTNNQRV